MNDLDLPLAGWALDPRLVGLAFLLSACGEAPGNAPDAATERDAALREAGFVMDASADAGAMVDAGRDVGPPPSSLCAAGACDPREPAIGCLDASVDSGTCTLASRAPACEVVGALTEGARCADELACAPGLACFRDGPGGVCARVCCPGEDGTCEPGERCSADGVLVNGISTSWGRCQTRPQACDVLMPAATCAPREGCYIVWPLEPLGPIAECRLAGAAGAGDPCSLPSERDGGVGYEECGAGLFCAGLPGNRACVRICRLSNADGCGSTERCMAAPYSPLETGICVAR